ncbi:MAG: TonB-dependent receptor, partial [Odoribacter sp.]|nr:TonB-dependent receptor [Odoribacter sp.]
LSQRYNNVWLNNSAVPSSESDTRTFSFDMIPGSQIDNIIIVKSPQPELPADFSGGFIKIATKSIPNKNSFEFSYGTSINTQTHFREFKYNKGSGTDFLGFDNGKRSLADFVPNRLNNYDSEQVTAVTKSGFNNDWKIHTRKPILDQKFNFLLNQKFQNEHNRI